MSGSKSDTLLGILNIHWSKTLLSNSFLMPLRSIQTLLSPPPTLQKPIPLMSGHALNGGSQQLDPSLPFQCAQLIYVRTQK